MTVQDNQNKQRKGLLAGASVIAGAFAAALAPGLAHAQDAEDDIVVTGTRIPQPNLYTTSPVTQVTSEDITSQGVTRVEDMVNQLPQAFAAQNATVSNGASGTASINLRNLGATRTLVLIDGRRMGYSYPAPGGSAADINSIPGPLIDRVEILTGGASAVYGSDAIAGVVNFIMRSDFEGVRLDAQYGFFQHNNDYDESTDGTPSLRDVIAARAAVNPAQFAVPADEQNDGFSKEASVIIGATTEDGRGNVMAYATYRNNDAVLQRDRDFSACSIAGLSGSASWVCSGSNTSYPGLFGTPNGNFTVDDQGAGSDQFRAFSAATDAYNFGPSNFFQRPDERYSLGSFARYEINEHAEVFAQLMFNDYTSNAQIAPSGAFFNTSRIDCDNPLLSAQQRETICEQDYVADIVDDPLTPDDERQDAIDALLEADAAADNPLGLTPAQAAFLVDRTVGDQTCLGDDPANALDDVGSASAFNVTDTYGNSASCILYIGRRNVEGGPRQDRLHFATYRGVLGVRGPINDSWSYDVAAQYQRTQLDRVYRNDFSATRIARALDVVNTGPDGVDGTADDAPICRSVVNGVDPACVPYNIFEIGGVTQAALTYLQIPLLQQASMTQQVVTANITGDLGFGSPLAESNLQTAFGVEYRRDALAADSDLAFTIGDGAGQGGPTTPLSGALDVFDLYGELRVPLIEQAPFADLVSMDLAYRRSSYSSGIETDSYKIGGDWAPSPDLRLRASYQRAVRAANIIELFTAPGFNLFNMGDDPCDATDPNGDGYGGDVACIGANPWQVTNAQAYSGTLSNPAGQYNFLAGGNTNLEPETADTYTVGIVATPSFLPGFNLSLDWFEIQVDDLISIVPSASAATQCYQGSDVLCQLIIRNTGNGRLWTGAGVVIGTNVNIGYQIASGFDLNANYRIDLADMGIGGGDAGALSFSLVGTWLQTLKFNNGDGLGFYDCVGFFGSVCGQPSPRWRHRFRAGWETPWDLELAGTWRYYGESEASIATPSAALPNRLDSVFEAQSYFDISGSWQLRDNASVRFGVNNILDDDPPISSVIGTFGNGNTFPQTYDSLGRYFFAGVTVDF
ncbi:MAG: TonB-dependent receptor [Hyphomonadaceae bacterium]